MAKQAGERLHGLRTTHSLQGIGRPERQVIIGQRRDKRLDRSFVLALTGNIDRVETHIGVRVA